MTRAGLGNVLWRLTIGGAYLVGLAWWARAALPVPLTRGQTGLLFLQACVIELQLG